MGARNLLMLLVPKKKHLYKIVAFILVIVAAQLTISYLYNRDIETTQSKSKKSDTLHLETRHVLSKSDDQESLKAPDVPVEVSPTPNKLEIHVNNIQNSFNADSGPRAHHKGTSPSPGPAAFRFDNRINKAMPPMDFLGYPDANIVVHNQRPESYQQKPKTKQWETYDYENPYNLLEIRVDRASEHTEGQGQPWPMPQSYTSSSTLVAIDLTGLSIITPSESCDRLKRAARRYTDLLRSKADLYIPDGYTYQDPPSGSSLKTLTIDLKRNCQDGDMPHEHMSEQYRLTIERGSATLAGTEVWGVIRGLETFAQLIWYNPAEQHAVINVTLVKDYPRFRYRGLHIDTARHYMSVRTLKRLLESMAFNKFNALNWHITDDQSFPYVSSSFPKLHAEGAYSKEQIYEPTDVKKLIDYAADRGIRVIPEFDMPGHTRSWGLGYPKLLTNCSNKHHPFGAVNPINDYTYDFMKAFWSEIRSVFPDHYQNLGSDEINYKCWLHRKDIRDFMIKNNMTKDNYDYMTLDGDRLQGYFLKRLIDIMPKDRMKVAWEEAFNSAQIWNISTDELIINVWKGGDYEWQYTMEQIVRRGYKAILSAPWYLNYISYGTDWHKYYEQDPHSFLQYTNAGQGNMAEQYRDQVIGGQVCIWSEFIDDNNLEPILWPRAIAPAEKLWSSADLRDWRPAQGRFEQQRCRMSRRGIKTSPNSGPGTCFGSMKIKPPYEPPFSGY